MILKVYICINILCYYSTSVLPLHFKFNYTGCITLKTIKKLIAKYYSRSFINFKIDKIY